MQQIGEAAAFTNTELSTIDSSALTEVSTAADSAYSSLDSTSTSATDASTNVDKIQPDNIQETTTASDNLTGALEGVAGAAAAVGGILVIDEMVNKAGEFEDTWSRIAGVMGTTSDAVESEWSGAMSQMKETTGRGAGDIRNYIHQMGLAGVESQEAITTSFSGVAGAAFMTNQSIDSITQAVKRVVSTGVLGRRQLMSLGITTDDIFAATGMTIDQVNEKMKNMDSTQRTMLISEILNKKYAVEGNQAYMLSWQRVKDELGRAYDYTMRIFGGLILPVVMPAISFVSRQLSGLASYIQNLDPVSRGLLGTVLLLGGGFVIVGGAAATLLGIYKALGISKALDATATWLGVTADNAKFMGTTRVIVGEIGRRAATVASTVATGAQTAATYVALTALTLYNNAIWGTSAAYAKDVISKSASVVATGAQAVATATATTAQWLLNAAMSANPIGIVVIAIAALVAGLYLLYTNNEQVRNSINSLWAQLEGFGEYIKGTFLNTVTGLISPFRELANRIESFGSDMYNAGVNWINDLIRGMEDSIPNIDDVLNEIGRYFPHSPAETGPLSEITPDSMESYGYLLGEGLAKGTSSGLKENLKGIEQTGFTGLFQDMQKVIQGNPMSIVGGPFGVAILASDYRQSMIDIVTEDTQAKQKIAANNQKMVDDAFEDLRNLDNKTYAVYDNMAASAMSAGQQMQYAMEISAHNSAVAWETAMERVKGSFSALNSMFGDMGISMPGKTYTPYQMLQMRNQAIKEKELELKKAKTPQERWIIEAELKQLKSHETLQDIMNSGQSIGSAFSQGLANGISSGTGAIQNAAANATYALKANSPPREGPLMEIDKWGLSIGQTFTESIAQGMQSVSDMFNVNSPSFNTPLPSTIPSSTSGSISYYEINVQVDELGDITTDEAKEKSKIIGKGILDAITKDTVRQASIGGISVQNMLRS